MAEQLANLEKDTIYKGFNDATVANVGTTMSTTSQTVSNAVLQTADRVWVNIRVPGALESMRIIELYPETAIGFCVMRATTQYSTGYFYWHKDTGAIDYALQTNVNYAPVFDRYRYC